MPDTILVVEDDPSVRSFVEEYLGGNGYRVLAVGDGGAMTAVMARETVDLVILDIMLPGVDGLQLTRTLRAKSQVPIIMVTGRGDTVDRVVGLEVGADDYLPKPFDPRELLARVRSLLRRAQARAADGATGEPSERVVARFAGWSLDTRLRDLKADDGREVKLTAAELDLLIAFATHPNRVLSREQLLDLTYGREMFPFERSIDTLVARVRRTIEADRRNPALIKTVRSAGYIFTPSVLWS